jgi:hypothetical protein
MYTLLGLLITVVDTLVSSSNVLISEFIVLLIALQLLSFESTLEFILLEFLDLKLRNVFISMYSLLALSESRNSLG